MFSSSCIGGKCTQQAELSGENINITYRPDGTHIAVGNRVLSSASCLYTCIICSWLDCFMHCLMDPFYMCLFFLLLVNVG